MAGDFTEEEVFTVVVEDFMEAGSEAEGFTEGEGSAVAGFTVEVVSTAEADFVAERASVAEHFVAARFEAELAFAEDPSAAESGEAFVAMASASGAVSVSADAAGVGAGAGA